MAKTKTQNKTSQSQKKKLKVAVIFLSGQQFLIKEGEEFLVDYLKGKKSLKIKPYLVVDGNKVLIGKPEVRSYVCHLKVVESELKGEKKIAFKYKPKTGYHRKKGVRTLYSLVRVESIKQGK
ncbi:50S ribosomal protein L21 [bacterium]|nr:50S ribosomal protein L21 [bacterium]